MVSRPAQRLSALLQEAERAKLEEDERERHIALGNPLLNKTDFSAGGKRRWDDDVVFKNQARGTEDKKKKEFVNVSTKPSSRVIYKLTSCPGSSAVRFP